MIAAQAHSAFVVRENRFSLFPIMLKWRAGPHAKSKPVVAEQG
jgi:hypothetical protein